MNLKIALLAVLTADFLALTAWVVFSVGLVPTFDYLMASPAGWLAVTDLLLALGVALYWMHNDAKARGVSAMPYTLLTLGTGSAGPLLYLINRERAKLRRPSGAAPQPAGV